MIIVLIGPAGSGKGTVAQAVEKEFKWPQISMGELLREEAAKGTAFGKKIGKLIDRGILVPNDWTVRLLKKRIAKKDCKNGFQLDGFPRKIGQAKRFEKFLAGRGRKIGLILYLNASRQSSIGRLGNRVQCRKCSRIYGAANLRPRKAGVCDYCKGKLVERIDDRPRAILKRLEKFHNETMPVIRRYKKMGILREINADVDARLEYLQARGKILAELKYEKNEKN